MSRQTTIAAIILFSLLSAPFSASADIHYPVRYYPHVNTPDIYILSDSYGNYYQYSHGAYYSLTGYYYITGQQEAYPGRQHAKQAATNENNNILSTYDYPIYLDD